jgi:ABC-2 type transport system ATP-binding protein
VIETKKLTKKYGEMHAIRSIDLKLDVGDVFGFIGPNGAGKTTTMRILATLLNPTLGEAYVGGYSIYTKPKEIRRIVGYMPDFFGVYDDMRVIEYLEFFAAAYRIRAPGRRKVCNEMLDLVDLDFKRNAFANTLSRGQTQRLGLARVLLHDPQVLLLDEPASGLDPRARIELMEILRELASMGKTIFISSHILSELATLCDSVTIIDRGKIKYSGDMEQLLTQTEGDHAEFVIQTSTAVPDLAAAIGRVPGVSDVVVEEGDEREMTVVFDPHQVTTGQVLEAAIRNGADVVMFQRNRRHLDEAFMDLTEPGVRS